jgi:hypothetical protein
VTTPVNVRALPPQVALWVGNRASAQGIERTLYVQLSGDVCPDPNATPVCYVPRAAARRMADALSAIVKATIAWNLPPEELGARQKAG